MSPSSNLKMCSRLRAAFRGRPSLAGRSWPSPSSSSWTLAASVAGLTVPNDVKAETVWTVAGIYAIVSIVLSLFIGGYAASMLTAGESKNEGVVYGVLVWATTISILMLLGAAGAKAGFNSLVTVATAGKVASDKFSEDDFDKSLKEAGLSDENIKSMKASVKDDFAKLKEKVKDPETQQQAADVASKVGLFAFFGVLASLIAAAFGGLVGAGVKVFSVDVGPKRNKM